MWYGSCSAQNRYLPPGVKTGDCEEPFPTPRLNIQQPGSNKGLLCCRGPHPPRTQTIYAFSIWEKVQEHQHPRKWTETHLLFQSSEIHHPISSHTHPPTDWTLNFSGHQTLIDIENKSCWKTISLCPAQWQKNKSLNSYHHSPSHEHDPTPPGATIWVYTPLHGNVMNMIL